MKESSPVLIRATTEDIVQGRLNAFDSLRSGKLILLKARQEVQNLRDCIFDVLRHRSPEHVKDINAFLDNPGHHASDAALATLVDSMRVVRDLRIASALFSDLIEAMNLPTPLVIDTGHFRCVLPGRCEAIRKLSPEPPSLRPTVDPEPTVVDRFGGAPHRDMGFVGQHFQANLWFPLHALSRQGSLILFPDVYHTLITDEYKKVALRSDPNEWGYGQAVQIDFEFGDIVIFDCNQLHASPVQLPDDRRLSIELRIAGGVEGDHGFAYRQLFCNSKNFRSLKGHTTIKRAGSILNPDLAAEPTCAQDAFARSFQSPIYSRQALIAGESEVIVGAAAREARAHLFDTSTSLLRLPPDYVGDDVVVAGARIAYAADDAALGDLLLSRALSITESYLWALEIGRLYAKRNELIRAKEAFTKALDLAGTSKVSIGQYVGTQALPILVPLQFMPSHAIRAANHLLNLIQTEPDGHQRLFDYRFFWPRPEMIGSFENGDLVRFWNLYVFVPNSKPFTPESATSDFEGMSIGASPSEVLSKVTTGEKLTVERPIQPCFIRRDGGNALVQWLGGYWHIPLDIWGADPYDYNIFDYPSALVSNIDNQEDRHWGNEHPLETELLVEDYKSTQYNIVKHGETFYGLHQHEGPFDITRIEQSDHSHPIFRGNTIETVTDQLVRQLVRSKDNSTAHPAVNLDP